jgi:hypothetical protein
MKIVTIRILSVIVLLSIIGIVQACQSLSPPQVNTQATADESSLNTQFFEVSSLTINPPEINLGVQVIVTAQVTNTGATANNYTPTLRIDDATREILPSYLYLNDIEIATGATELISFVLTSNVPGIYKITWGDISEELRVVQGDENSAGNYDGATKITAPDFTSSDVVTNQNITLSSFKGSAVLLNFVNYGCDTSLNKVVSNQLITIRGLKDQRGDFIPVSVFCGCCPEEVLRDFANQNSFIWPWILDSDYSIVNHYADYLREYGYPTLIFIDQEQYIREVAGYSDLSDLSAKVDQLISINN